MPHILLIEAQLVMTFVVGIKAVKKFDALGREMEELFRGILAGDAGDIIAIGGKAGAHETAIAAGCAEADIFRLEQDDLLPASSDPLAPRNLAAQLKDAVASGTFCGSGRTAFGGGVPVGTTEEPKTSIATAAPLPAVVQAGV